jgi:hypothetical protein
MSANSNEVTQSVESFASVSEENSASVEEVSAGTEEMTAQVEEVGASAQTLADMAANLTGLVAKFKLDSGAFAPQEALYFAMSEKKQRSSQSFTAGR